MTVVAVMMVMMVMVGSVRPGGDRRHCDSGGEKQSREKSFQESSLQ